MEKKERMKNLELLRCIAMMMVVVLHFLGKGKLLGDTGAEDFNSINYTAWVLESFCLVAVNVYMLISGYLLCQSHFKLSRLISLLLQVWFYSILIGLAGLALGTATEPLSIYYLLQILLPISMNQYWFISAYVLLYILLPVLGVAVQGLTKKQHQISIFTLLTAFSLVKSLVPGELTLDAKGYDVLWYITLFVVAAYFRKYEVNLFQKKGMYLCLYFLGVICIFGGIMGYRMIYLTTGKLQTVLTACMDYNHLFVFAASLFFFLFFTKIEVKGLIGTVAGFAGPLTLGVYLLHESIGVRYAWPKWFGAEQVTSPLQVVLYTLGAMVCVFVIGILVEWIRKSLFGVADKFLQVVPIYKKGKDRLKKIDQYFVK